MGVYERVIWLEEGKIYVSYLIRSLYPPQWETGIVVGMEVRMYMYITQL